MTIHHDKLAYGRLKSLNDEMSADEIANLVEALNAEEEDEDKENVTPPENKKNNKE